MKAIKKVKKERKPVLKKIKKMTEKKKKRSGGKMIVKPKKRAALKRGKGIINKIIDKLPFELHVPKYQYCGPGTKLEKRLARGDPGINPLDVACKQHDMAYTEHSSTDDRYLADKQLQKAAMKRVFSKDASFGERATALGVAAAMKAKRTLTSRTKTTGKGLTSEGKCCKKKQISFQKLVQDAKIAIKKSKPENIESAIKVAVASVKKTKRGKKVKKPRIINLPSRSGGVLPLIPIFAGLSALGSIAGTTTSVISALNRVKEAERMLHENQRHNQTMEAIAIGNKKSGTGFYLSPYKSGDGFYLSPFPKNH